jgi:hypothetical protein
MRPDERRGAARQAVNLRVRLGDTLGETRDVSATGVCFYVAGPAPAVGSRIDFLIELPSPLPESESETAFRFEAEVVRVEEEGDRVAVAARFGDWEVEAVE